MAPASSAKAVPQWPNNIPDKPDLSVLTHTFSPLTKDNAFGQVPSYNQRIKNLPKKRVVADTSFNLPSKTSAAPRVAHVPGTRRDGSRVPSIAPGLREYYNPQITSIYATGLGGVASPQLDFSKILSAPLSTAGTYHEGQVSDILYRLRLLQGALIAGQLSAADYGTYGFPLVIQASNITGSIAGRGSAAANSVNPTWSEIQYEGFVQNMNPGWKPLVPPTTVRQKMSISSPWPSDYFYKPAPPPPPPVPVLTTLPVAPPPVSKPPASAPMSAAVVPPPVTASTAATMPQYDYDALVNTPLDMAGTYHEGQVVDIMNRLRILQSEMIAGRLSAADYPKYGFPLALRAADLTGQIAGMGSTAANSVNNYWGEIQYEGFIQNLNPGWQPLVPPTIIRQKPIVFPIPNNSGNFFKKLESNVTPSNILKAIVAPIVVPFESGVQAAATVVGKQAVVEKVFAPIVTKDEQSIVTKVGVPVAIAVATAGVAKAVAGLVGSTTPAAAASVAAAGGAAAASVAAAGGAAAVSPDINPNVPGSPPPLPNAPVPDTVDVQPYVPGVPTPPTPLAPTPPTPITSVPDINPSIPGSPPPLPNASVPDTVEVEATTPAPYVPAANPVSSGGFLNSTFGQVLTGAVSPVVAKTVAGEITKGQQALQNLFDKVTGQATNTVTSAITPSTPVTAMPTSNVGRNILYAGLGIGALVLVTSRIGRGPVRRRR